MKVIEKSQRGVAMGLIFVEGEVGFEMGLHEFGKLSDIDFTGWAVEVWLGWLFSGA